MSNAMTKENYEHGLRCRGICQLCPDNLHCYQYKMNQKDKTSPKISFEKVYPKDVVVHTTITMGVNDIFNWLTECPNIEDLKYLGKYALTCAKNLENPDEDRW